MTKKKPSTTGQADAAVVLGHVNKTLTAKCYTRDMLTKLLTKCRGLAGSIPGTKIGRAAWWEAFVGVMFETATRAGFILRLKWRHIDLNTGVIRPSESDAEY